MHSYLSVPWWANPHLPIVLPRGDLGGWIGGLEQQLCPKGRQRRVLELGALLSSLEFTGLPNTAVGCIPLNPPAIALGKSRLPSVSR